MKHAAHRMHANSLAGWDAYDPSPREKAIVEYLSKRQPMTDREIRDGMGFNDLNQVRPRITEMHDKGVMFEYGIVECPVTGRAVRVSGVRGVHWVTAPTHASNNHDKT